MNNLFRSITLLLLMFILGSVSAQNQSLNVKGTVRDAMGDPIIGATILQQGSTYGTISNKDGEFSDGLSNRKVHRHNSRSKGFRYCQKQKSQHWW